MARVVHVIVTDNFAGAERYVGTLARSCAAAGWAVTVVGGRQAPMREVAGDAVTWLPGSTLTEALRSLASAGRFDVCHAHMTYAETVGLMTRAWHRAPVVATRHFAAARGASRVGAAIARWIDRSLAGQVAISRFVADNLERPPSAVLTNGVAVAPARWSPASRTVLTLQRLEAEKDTLTAVRAWRASQLVDEGWRLRVVGDGAQRAMLERVVREEGIAGVEFGGWVPDVGKEFDQAGLCLATAPAEPLGLSVLEAMAAGIPVVATAAGGHLETVGVLPDAALFAPGDVEQAARLLRSLALDESARRRLSECGRAVQQSEFSLAVHAERVLAWYRDAVMHRPVGSVTSTPPASPDRWAG